MIIELKKFGKILTSRDAGREAFAAFLPTLKTLNPDKKIEIDFDGVSVLTPSWADEFIIPLKKQYSGRVSFINDNNASIKETFKMLDRVIDPNLDLHDMTIFANALVFDEKHDFAKNGFVMTFPYSDKEAIQMLIDNKVREVSLFPVDSLGPERLEQVVSMLNSAGIESKIGFSKL